MTWSQQWLLGEGTVSHVCSQEWLPWQPAAADCCAGVPWPCRDVRLLILEHGRWSMIDKYQTLMKGLSIDALSAFVTAFKSQLFVEGLVQGNFTSRVSAAWAAAVLHRGFSTLNSAAS